MAIINYNKMAQDYANQYRQRVAAEQQQMANQLAASKASTNANYESNAAQAYINRVRQENALPEQLRARGINGGASETAMTSLYNNYALGQSANEASRSAALGQLQNTYDTNIANMNAEMERAIADNNLVMAQKQAEYKQQQSDKLLEQYNATLERFTSTKSVDKALKKLKKSDPNYRQKKWLLQ
jgi:hypothetical protein